MNTVKLSDLKAGDKVSSIAFGHGIVSEIIDGDVGVAFTSKGKLFCQPEELYPSWVDFKIEVIEPESQPVSKDERLLTWEQIIGSTLGKTMWYISATGKIMSSHASVVNDRVPDVPTENHAKKLRAIAQLMVIAHHYNKMFPVKVKVVAMKQKNNIISYFMMGDAYIVPDPCFNSVDAFELALANNEEIFRTALMDV